MRIYGRGIRRRLAPMLGNDRRRVELAYALQFSLRGTPVLRYGEEIGMGDDLSLPGRQAIRTPMQWSQQPNAGFSSADPGKLVQPVIDSGDFGYERVNVTAQRADPGSLLAWFQRMMSTVREAPEIGQGSCTHVDVKLPSGVLAHRADGRFELHIHGTITTEDGQRISLHADGVALPQPGSPIVGLRENVTLFTSSKKYSWVNGLQVWATGTVNLAERVVGIKGYSA